MGKASRRKRERRARLPKPFQRMSLGDIIEKHACPRPYSKIHVKRDICPVCEMDVYLHCGDCLIQITGCLCTAVDRMSTEELHEFQAEIRRRRAKESGIILP